LGLALARRSRISSIVEAADQVEAWLESPVALLLTEAHSHWEILRPQLEGGRVRGAMVNDARLAALCMAPGVTEFWTADRDFSRFPDLPARNPLRI